MAGHSKWKQIKHKKAANDLKRGKVLTKHAKILMVVARNDANPETNASLRTALTNARADGVPRDNIERILKKASGEGSEASQYTENVYEGFGPNGIPIIVQSLTDNSNRAYTDIRTAFMKNGGNLGSSGSVSFMFDHLGIITFEKGKYSEDEIFELVTESGGQDFSIEEGIVEVITTFETLGKVRQSLESPAIEIKKSEPIYRAKDPVIITNKENLDKIENFIEAVEAVDDSDEVFAGFTVDDSLL